MSGRGAGDRRRLVERARAELPEPGDPRLLLADLRREGLHGPDALAIVERTTLAWQQLRDMRLERAWQRGFGWFLGRNLIALGVLALVSTLVLRMPLAIFEAILIGAGAYFVLVMALGPLRTRRHRARRAAILEAYDADLRALLEALREGRPLPGDEPPQRPLSEVPR